MNFVSKCSEMISHFKENLLNPKKNNLELSET